MMFPRTLAAVVLGAMAVGQAMAAPAPKGPLTLTGVACDGHATGMTSLTGYLDCSGSWSGNNLNQADAVFSQIAGDWGSDVLSTQNITGGNGGSSGMLSFAAQTGLFAIALKAGNAFSLYEFDGSQVSGGISSISYDTLGVGFTSGRNVHFGQSLSHADLYTFTSPVPEPATAALMLAGMGVLAWHVRRRPARAPKD